MASVRLSRVDQLTSYHVIDRDGNIVGHGANKNSASAWRNREAKAGRDVTGWTLRPVPKVGAPDTTEKR